MHTAIFLVSNIHCPSCVSYISDVLHNLAGVASPVEVSLIEHTVRVQYNETLTSSKAISDVLLNAAFEIKHITELDANHKQTQSYEIDNSTVTRKTTNSGGLGLRAKQKHVDNCLACQRERARRPSWWTPWGRKRVKDDVSQTLRKSSSTSPATSTAETTIGSDVPMVINVDGASGDNQKQENFVATILIGGMTCSSCTSAITKELEAIEYVSSVNVSLVTNSAKVVYHGPEDNLSNITNIIEDIGYEATVEVVQSSSSARRDQYRAVLSIRGMTCGACVGSITRGLQELQHVTSVNVDLISNSGIVEYQNTETLDTIREKMDDMGYDIDMVSMTSLRSTPQPAAERTIHIRIDGMYCHHCPEKVLQALHKLIPSATEMQAFHISQRPTLQDPILTITYKPSRESKITARRFVNTIDKSDEALAATIYQPPSLEERSRIMQRKERTLILLRLTFTAIMVIPTFIIGVVFMSLVPSTNRTRQWLEAPIWVGMAMRMDWALFIMTTPVMLFGADLFHRRAIKEIWALWRPKSKVPILRRFYRFGSMNLLISAGTTIAYFSSLAVIILDATTHDGDRGIQGQGSNTYFDTVTFLTFFLLIGRYLEAYSKAKTGDAVAMLSSLRPTEARLVEDDTVQSIPVDQLEINDVVQIAHGQSPPSDGVVDEEGNFLFDESSLTGEPRPVKKMRGEQVFAGTVNVSNTVRVKVTDIGGTSMLSQIIDVVRDGQAKRAPIERLADILTGYFVPVITLVAVTTWLIWLGLGLGGLLPSAWLDVRRGGWPFWSMEFAIAVFVVACPCGIGLAAPTALFVGGGLAAKSSILVQGGGEAFQEASQLTTIVFDKTGTLTQGQMQVTELEILSMEWDATIIKVMSKVLEDASTHPIAKAVSEYCSYIPANLEHKDIEEHPGKGMVGTFLIDGVRYDAALGNGSLLSFLNDTSDPEKSDDTPTQNNEYLSKSLQKHQLLGHSTAIFAIKHLPVNSSASDSSFQPIAIFAISDPIRPEAPLVLASLHASGLDVHMCTGDNSTTARAVAGQLAIPVSKVRAGVSPQDKAVYIRELQHPPLSTINKDKRRIVAFVGDGTNDTPALSAADVSIALSSGSDIAMTTASFILLNTNLNTILTLVSLSKRVFRRVKLNFAWAAMYNICLVPVAAGVFYAVGANEEHGGWRLSPVWASCAMAASSVSVVCSSLALRWPEMRIPEMIGWVRALRLPGIKAYTP